VIACCLLYNRRSVARLVRVSRLLPPFKDAYRYVFGWVNYILLLNPFYRLIDKRNCGSVRAMEHALIVSSLTLIAGFCLPAIVFYGRPERRFAVFFGTNICRAGVFRCVTSRFMAVLLVFMATR
jgi:hypothetical protein